MSVVKAEAEVFHYTAALNRHTEKQKLLWALRGFDGIKVICPVDLISPAATFTVEKHKQRPTLRRSQKIETARSPGLNSRTVGVYTSSHSDPILGGGNPLTCLRSRLYRACHGQE